MGQMGCLIPLTNNVPDSWFSTTDSGGVPQRRDQRSSTPVRRVPSRRVMFSATINLGCVHRDVADGVSRQAQLAGHCRDGRG